MSAGQPEVDQPKVDQPRVDQPRVDHRGVGRRAVLTAAAAAVSLAACDAAGGADPDTSPAPSGSPAVSEPSDLSPRLSWGPSQAELERARSLVAAYTPEQLAGQVLVLTYAGTEPDDAAAAVRAVHAAGVIVMGDNVVSAEQVRSTADAVRKAVHDDGRDLLAVVAVDQEGGLVSRLGSVVPGTPTFMTAGAAIAADAERGAKAVTAAAQASGAMLRTIGISWVFAPDADVTLGPQDPTIGSRSASSDPAIVSAAVTAALSGYHGGGIASCVKHYPGHGSVTADSHTTLPVQHAPIDELRARDLVPFSAAVTAGVPAMMMSHIAVDAFEPGVPSTLSARAYESLRAETGFEGVICTDAMNMQAVTDTYGAGPAAAKAVIAGADVVLMPASGPEAHAALLAALADGSLPEQRLQDAAARVVAMQLWQGSIPPVGTAKNAVRASEESSKELSAAGITQVSGTCGTVLVSGGAVTLSGGTPKDIEAFTKAAKAAGVSLGSGPRVALATSQAPVDGDIVVAVDTPYVLARCRAETAAFALYGRTEGAFAALLDVLTGKKPPRGTLPVPVEGLQAVSC